MQFLLVSHLLRPVLGLSTLVSGVLVDPSSFPSALPQPPATLDVGVILLFIPILALMTGMLLLALRLISHGGSPAEFTPDQSSGQAQQDEEG